MRLSTPLEVTDALRAAGCSCPAGPELELSDAVPCSGDALLVRLTLVHHEECVFAESRRRREQAPFN